MRATAATQRPPTPAEHGRPDTPEAETPARRWPTPSLASAGYAACGWAVVIIPALTGSAFAAAHALTAYITKPLHLVGVIALDFPGWARLNEDALILWDLLFYEPWFLGLGVLVTLGTLDYYRRTGGLRPGARRLLGAAAAGTLALTALNCALIVA